MNNKELLLEKVNAWKFVADLALVVVALAFPRFGRAYEMTRGWADQSMYMLVIDMADAKKIKAALAVN